MSYAPPIQVQSGKMLSNMRTRPGRTSGQPTVHAGMDLNSGNRTPVIAVQGGVVETVSDDLRPAQGLRGYGNAVVINHGNGTWALYGHMSSVAVAPGQRVAAGTMVGRIGNTSNGRFSPPSGQSPAQWRAADPDDPARRKVMAPHLHLELRRAAAGGSSPYLGTNAGRGYGTLTIDPKPWLESGGLIINRNLTLAVQPGSAMDRTRSTWSALSDDVTDYGFEPQEFEADYPLYGLFAVGLLLVGVGVALNIRNRLA